MDSSLDSQLQLSQLHLDDLIWTQHQIQPSPQRDIQTSLQASTAYKNTTKGNKIRKTPQQQSNTNKFNHKDDILTYIKPDYGSLGEFITGVNITTDFIKQKKKKYDPQEDSEEKKIKTYLQNKNLNKVLTNSTSTSQQRTIACKLFIQRTFQQAFGSPINQFYQQQSHKSAPQQQSGILNLNNLSDALDEIISKSKKKQQQKPNNSLQYMKQHLKRNRSFRSDAKEFINERQLFLKQLIQMKNNYRSLNKSTIPDQPTGQFVDWQEKYPGSQQSRSLHNQLHHSIYYSNNSGQLLLQQQSEMIPVRNTDEKVFIINDKQVIIWNIPEISTQTVLYILSNVSLCELVQVTLIKCSFTTPDVLNLFLDLLSMQARTLRALVIDDVSNIHDKKIKEKFSSKIKAILQIASESLMILKLNSLELETKDFCVLCLGIGSSRKLEHIEIKNNNIDEHGKKSYDVLIKFFKNLHINLQGNPINSEITKVKASKYLSTTTLSK